MSVYEMQQLTIVGPWKPAPRLLRPLVERFGKEVSVSCVFRFDGGTWMNPHKLELRVWWKWSVGSDKRRQRG